LAVAAKMTKIKKAFKKKPYPKNKSAGANNGVFCGAGFCSCYRFFSVEVAHGGASFKTGVGGATGTAEIKGLCRGCAREHRLTGHPIN
jgi:hypothetical protein